MSHTLINALPGGGKTRTARELAQAAVERGDTVVVITTPFHTDEWSDVSGVTVTSDEALLEKIAHREETTPLTLIVDDIEKLSPEAQRVLERIVRLGRATGVSTVITTSRVERMPAGIRDNTVLTAA